MERQFLFLVDHNQMKYDIILWIRAPEFKKRGYDRANAKSQLFSTHLLDKFYIIIYRFLCIKITKY